MNIHEPPGKGRSWAPSQNGGNESAEHGRVLQMRPEVMTAKAHEAFLRYLGLGADRSLAKVRQLYGTHIRLLERWSTRYNWVERARAWDAHRAEERLRDAQDRLREHAESKIEVADRLLIRALAVLETTELKPGDAVGMVRLAHELADAGLEGRAQTEGIGLSRGRAREVFEGLAKVVFKYVPREAQGAVQTEFDQLQERFRTDRSTDRDTGSHHQSSTSPRL